MGVDHRNIRTPLAPFVDGADRRARFSVRPRPPRPLDHVDGLLAGAAEVDITPPPGMPKAGYSANAHDGIGFHTRLRARVTHLRSGTSSVAIVQLDLLGGSSVLQHLVAEAIADGTDIPLAGVWIGATHTHAAPGQFLGTDFYNHHASNRAGFDPAWTDFLVRRISAAIIDAYETRGPARAAFGTTEVWGLTRNRSHDPYVHNDTVTDKRLDPQRKWVAVNPRLHMLRVDRVGTDGRTRPLSAAMVFSIHGTGVSQHAREYNADVWAYLVGETARRIETATGTRPVVGAMEGTHADVAPALRPGLAGHREARRIGTAVGAEAAALHGSLGDRLDATFHLDTGLREIDLDVDRSINGIALPDRPAVGAALVAGAAENLTPIVNRIPPFKAGHPKRRGTDNPQGEKWVIGSRWLQPLVLPKRGFPRILAVQLVRLGDAALVGLPFEITVESGRRIGAAVEDALDGTGVDCVVVSSVVNEYWGYVATAEEYRRQYYEGGHTLYGPNTQRFLAAHARSVARSTIGSAVFQDVGPERSWNLASRRWYSRSRGAGSPRRHFDGTAHFVDPTAQVDGYWEQSWMDVEPSGLDWHEPIVAVEFSDDDGATWAAAHRDDGTPVDDQSWMLEVTHLAVDESGRDHYRVRWFEPAHRAGRLHRFVLRENHGRPRLEGPAFD